MNSQYSWIVPLLCLLCFVSCTDRVYDHLFTATLVSAEYNFSGGWSSMEWWELRFDNGRTIIIREYDIFGDIAKLRFIEGQKYDVSLCRNRYFRLEVSK